MNPDTLTKIYNVLLPVLIGALMLAVLLALTT